MLSWRVSQGIKGDHELWPPKWDSPPMQASGGLLYTTYNKLVTSLRNDRRARVVCLIGRTEEVIQGVKVKTSGNTNNGRAERMNIAVVVERVRNIVIDGGSTSSVSKLQLLLSCKTPRSIYIYIYLLVNIECDIICAQQGDRPSSWITRSIHQTIHHVV